MITIDPGSAAPPYQQIRDTVIAQIEAGQLSPGTQLPPVRRLAADLGIAANTVAKAYRQLEAEGRVRGEGRKGTIVASPVGETAAQEEGLALAQSFVQSMRALGHEPDVIVAMARRALG